MTARPAAALAFCGLLAACGAEPSQAEAGRRAVAEHDCGVCHVVPGVRGARGRLGPSLAGFANRRYIGGSVPNEPALLAQWVRAAPDLIPKTAMPRLPIDEGEARDIAAYLATLR